MFAYTTVITSLFRVIGFLWGVWWNLPWWVSLWLVVRWGGKIKTERSKSRGSAQTEPLTLAHFFTELRRKLDEH